MSAPSTFEKIPFYVPSQLKLVLIQIWKMQNAAFNSKTSISTGQTATDDCFAVCARNVCAAGEKSVIVELSRKLKRSQRHRSVQQITHTKHLPLWSIGNHLTAALLSLKRLPHFEQSHTRTRTQTRQSVLLSRGHSISTCTSLNSLIADSIERVKLQRRDQSNWGHFSSVSLTSHPLIKTRRIFAFASAKPLRTTQSHFRSNVW